ncbi:MAG: cellulase family glycosylhydrolase [Anaerolineae bacterium]|jgi:hypothetical protein
MKQIDDKNGLQQAREAGVQLTRLSIWWPDVEPVRTEPPTYEWQALNKVEQCLANAAMAGIEVEVAVLFAPDWALAQPGHRCGPIAEDRLDEYAQFLSALVARYSQAPYNVKYWELGNEPDVDPVLVPPTSGYGCWGDETDAFYGGRRYAQMLKHAYPAIKAADPRAQVILGGLLLFAPDISPATFLAGVLEGGGGEFFDILAYHAYIYYDPTIYNWTTASHAHWNDWGGVETGKARFLRQVLADYGYDKPLMLNEAGLAWWPAEEPTEDFRQAQADYVVKLYTRAQAIELENVIWYGWRGPGFHYVALLNDDLSPTPAYHAFAFAVQQFEGARYLSPTNYLGTEGYEFQRGARRLQVIWSADGEAHRVAVPAERFVGAWQQDGRPADYEETAGEVSLAVLRPVYVALEVEPEGE